MMGQSANYREQMSGRAGVAQVQIVGVQGGRGSFNEQAALTHLSSFDIGKFELRYLHTTENVIKALENNEIDFGQFAIHNSLGGDVQESLKAMNGHNLTIIGQYKIKIAHALMIGPHSQLSDIDTVLTHPQVIRQCQQNFENRFAHIKLTSGEGELIDPAKVAELLGQAKLPKSIATASNKALAEIHGLSIVAENLQDSDDNYTTFILVKCTDDTDEIHSNGKSHG